MNVGRVNRLASLYNANSLYNVNSVKNVNGVDSVGSSPTGNGPRTASPLGEGIVSSPGDAAPPKNNLAAFYTSPDGDSAEISKKAMELWRGLADGGGASLDQPFSRQPGADLIFSRDLDLPSPFLNLDELVNNAENPFAFSSGAPSTDIKPPQVPLPSVTPPKTEPPAAPAPNNAPPAAPAPNNAPPVSPQPGGTKPDIELPGVEMGTVKFDTVKPKGQCKTCESRRYVDQSDDPSVSFQTPTKVNPNMAMGAVTAHENEHVRNEQGKAQREGREIVNQTVTLSYDTCPECGRHYVSGGTTRTTSISRSEDGNRPEAGKAPEGSSSGNGN